MIIVHYSSWFDLVSLLVGDSLRASRIYVLLVPRIAGTNLSQNGRCSMLQVASIIMGGEDDFEADTPLMEAWPMGSYGAVPNPRCQFL